MKTIGLLVVLVLVSFPQPLHGQEDGCEPGDMELITSDFIDQVSSTTSESERLDLMFEYLTVVTGCQPDIDCSVINTLYMERLSGAETPSDQLLTTLDLSVHLLFCYPEKPDVPSDLTTIFGELGLTCTVPAADASYIQAQCSGTHNLGTAQAMYDAALAYLGVERVFFDVMFEEGEATAYTFTGGEWRVTPHEE